MRAHPAANLRRALISPDYHYLPRLIPLLAFSPQQVRSRPLARSNGKGYDGCRMPSPLTLKAPVVETMEKPSSPSHTLSPRSSVVDRSRSVSPFPTPPFTWTASERNLITADAFGTPVVSSTTLDHCPDVRLSIENELPLLYWAERNEWMWHKKWSLPKISVHIERSRVQPSTQPSTQPSAQPSTRHDRVVVLLSAGILSDGTGATLQHVGLSGKRQVTVELGPTGAVVNFTNLYLQQTSYHCGGQRFRFAVTILTGPTSAQKIDLSAADAPTPQPQQQPIACAYSAPFYVDARKRSKSERPLAEADDPRLRHRGCR